MSIVRCSLNLTGTVFFSFALAEILSKTDGKTLEEKVYKIDTTFPLLFRVIGLNYTDNTPTVIYSMILGMQHLKSHTYD